MEGCSTALIDGLDSLKLSVVKPGRHSWETSSEGLPFDQTFWRLCRLMASVSSRCNCARSICRSTGVIICFSDERIR